MLAEPSGPPTHESLLLHGSNRGDRLFANTTLGTAALIPILLVAVVVLLMLDAFPAVQSYGFGFLVTTDWDPVFERFGAAAYIFGTLVTALLGLLLATPVAVGTALFLTEYAPRVLRSPVAFLV